MNKEITLRDVFNHIKPSVLRTDHRHDSFALKYIVESLQSASREDVVFYKLRKGEQAWKQFLERYRNSDHGLLIMCGNPLNRDEIGRYIIVKEEDYVYCQSLLLDLFYPFDPEKVKLVAITGTNGKTTTTHLSLNIAELLGKKALSIGTMGVCTVNGTQLESGLTTPSFVFLRKVLFQYQDKVDVIFIEASSHGLHQGRLFGLQFDCAGWTNFTQDHLDYHEDMEEYFRCKALIFDYLKKSKGAQLFIPSSEEVLKKKLTAFPFSIAKKLGSRQIINLPSALMQGFNKKNVELAFQINEALWNKPFNCSFESLEPPKGRLSQIKIDEKVVFIDFAHTPDALANILCEVKERYNNKPLYVVFGCGGDRDRLKRPKMGKIAGDICNSSKDHIFVTSDNPRNEDPRGIIEDILKGIETSANVHVIEDRRSAILKALSLMAPDSVLLVAGKGHEDYQEIKGKKHSFSDFNVVDEFKRGEFL